MPKSAGRPCVARPVAISEKTMVPVAPYIRAIP